MMINHSVFTDLDKIVTKAQWESVTNSLPSNVKGMRETIELPNFYMKEAEYECSCRLLNTRFEENKFPVCFNKDFFCSYCRSDRFSNGSCKSVAQVMQAYGEDLALKAEVGSGTSEAAANICLYLVKVSPENGYKLLHFLRNKPIYHQDEQYDKLLNQAAQKYQDAVQACERELRCFVELDNSLCKGLIDFKVFTPGEMEFLENKHNEKAEKIKHVLETLKLKPAESSRLFFEVLQKDTKHSGHENITAVKVSPENGYKLLHFLRNKPIYHQDEQYDKLLNQAAQKYQDAVQACERELRCFVELDNSLCKGLIDFKVFTPGEMEFLENKHNEKAEKIKHVLETLKLKPAESSRLFFEVLQKDTKHSGHENITEVIKEKLEQLE